MHATVTRFEMAAPDDMAHFAVALDAAKKARATRLAIIAKVEGAATRNDVARALTLRAMRDVLRPQGWHDETVQIVLSAGCEGLIAPGGYLLSAHDHGAGAFSGLSFGMARSGPIAPPDLLRVGHFQAARATVLAAMAQAGLTADQTALVLLKSPVLLRAEANALNAGGYGADSTILSRGAGALGIAAALNDIGADALRDEFLCRRDDLFCSRGMVFSGTETRRCEAIVLGNMDARQPCVRTGRIDDLLDIAGMAAIIAPGAPDAFGAARALAASGRLRAAFLKVGVRADGRVRDQRTTILTSELEPDKQLRAAASGVLAALLGDGRMFVSGGAEHQAPPGGGVFTVLVADD